MFPTNDIFSSTSDLSRLFDSRMGSGFQVGVVQEEVFGWFQSTDGRICIIPDKIRSSTFTRFVGPTNVSTRSCPHAVQRDRLASLRSSRASAALQ